MNSATRPSPRNVRSRRPSMNTGATGSSNVPGQRDADVGVLRFAWTVDDAAHDRHAQLLGSGMGLAPDRHLVLEIALDLLRHLLEERGGRPATAGAGRDLRQERSKTHRLEDLLGDLDLTLARSTGLRRQRHPDRVADALVQKDREARGRGDDPLVTHAGFRETEVERVVAPRGQAADRRPRGPERPRPWR